MTLKVLTDDQIEKIIDVFKDISRYKSKERENYDDLVKQKMVYTDIIPHSSCVEALFQTRSERKINYLIGRRGAGKTTLLNRVRIECFESFFIKKDLDYLKEEKMVLPVYVEMKSLFSNIIDKTDTSEDKIEELNQLFKIMNIEFLRQIELAYEELRELGIIDYNIFKKVENIIGDGIKKIEGRKTFISMDIEEEIKNFYIKLKDCIKQISFHVQNDILLNELEKNEKYSIDWKLIFNLDIFKEILNKLKSLKEYPLNYIHFLLDDFSEISILNQKIIIENFIEPIFKSVQDICFCIACYPNLYYSSSLKINQDYQIIDLDWYNLYSGGSFKEKIEKCIDILTQILLKRLKNVLPQIFKDERSLDIIFDEKPLFLKHLFFACMNIPRLMGLILSNPICLLSLQLKRKLSINDIKKASIFIFEEYLYKDYFRSLLKKEKSNDFFSEKEIIMDKVIIDFLVEILKVNFKDNHSSCFAIDNFLIQEQLNLLNRLEMLGFLFKIDIQPLSEQKIIFNWQGEHKSFQGLYCFYYGIYAKNDIDFNLNKIIDPWVEFSNKYDITSKLVDRLQEHEFYKCQNIECGKIWPITSELGLKDLNFTCDQCKIGEIKKEGVIDINSLFTKNEIPQIFIRDKNDLDQIATQLNDEQSKIIHTLYLNKDEDKGWMTTDEIGITKRISPFSLPHIRIIRIIRNIRNQGKAKFLMSETEMGKKLYRISNMGILFEQYCLWKLIP
ncbi:MAG: hypothetical protein ACFFA6_08420 [Promethearchaeota archaeon]